MEKVIICDIDGVILDGPWYDDIEDFYNNMDSWTPVQWSVDLIQCMADKGYKIIFVTARIERIRPKTTEQLQSVFNFPIDIRMRKNDDERVDWVMKKEIIQELQKTYDIQFGIDDGQLNCKMLQSLGITALHVLPKE